MIAVQNAFHSVSGSVRGTTRFCAGLLLSLSAAAISSAQTPAITIVSSANYQPVAAPNSLASIFGSNLASRTQPATLDANGQLPTELAGTTVEVNGEAAPLLYVSSRQINFLVPADAVNGSLTVKVQTSIGLAGKGSMQVADTAPALFSSDGSGTGAGSILNGVTYAPAPFLVETSANPGADRRTRLAVYGTGFRYAGNPERNANLTNVAANVTAQARDASGATYKLTVEYAGAAPGYFGLDQLNVVLPPDLDSSGVVSIMISTSDSSSNTVTFQMNRLPANAIHVAGLSISPNFVSVGDSATATVSLNGRAPAAGLNVSLSDNNAVTQVPPQVTVPQNQVSAQFTVTTSGFISSTQTATITAQSSGGSQSATLDIDPASAVQLQSLTLNPPSVVGGANVTASVVLSGAAPSGGATVLLTSNNAAVLAPAPLVVPFGQQAASATLKTNLVNTPQTATVTAAYGRTTQQSTLTINPPFTFTLSSNSVLGGSSVQGTITLGAPVNANLTFTLKSSDPASAQPPLSVMIPLGQSGTTFTVTTTQVSAQRTVNLTASSIAFPGFSQTATLAVAAPGSVKLQSLTISPSTVTGGQSTSGTLTLSGAAPIAGVTVTLRSNSIAAQIPQSIVLISSGQTTATFTINTISVIAKQTVTITATAGGVSQTATLIVQ